MSGGIVSEVDYDAFVVQAYRQELKCSRTPGYFTLIGDEPPPAAHNSSEVNFVILTPETVGTVGV